MTNSDTAIREFQRKYAMKTYRLNPETLQREQTGYDVNFMIDLTALISEHYYPKEFLLWTGENCQYYPDTNEWMYFESPMTQQYFKGTDELFNYWIKNVGR